MKYDESQIKRHPKRTKEQNKVVKQMLYHLDLMFGEQHAGEFLCMIVDALNRLITQETPDTHINLRTIEIRFNEAYGVKLDCDTGNYIE